jgi:hypothetical protein
LQLPTASSSVKSFKSTFEQLQSEKDSDTEEKIVKKEPLSKWAPVGEVNTNENNISQQVSIKTENKDDQVESNEQSSQMIQFNIKQEKQEVSTGNNYDEESKSSNQNQEVPVKSETKSNKKEKVIVFKKRKIESISLRERADE